MCVCAHGGASDEGKSQDGQGVGREGVEETKRRDYLADTCVRSTLTGLFVARVA